MHPTPAATLNTADLAIHGFTPGEIDRLASLKERYNPYREYFESNQEFERLAFLKWRYQQGQFTLEASQQRTAR